MDGYHQERFDSSERSALAPYFTNLDGPVFALRNMPEVTKGALFARYSRSSKSLRRLFLDEFLDIAPSAGDGSTVGAERAEGLYSRVLSGFGDDSVAQLGFAHVACEQVSNVLTKIIERGRLAAYLEQSTRYIAFTDKPGGRWRYVAEPTIAASELASLYAETLDATFDAYVQLLAVVEADLSRRYPHDAGDPETVWRRTIRAKACDALRGLLPLATYSNLGVAASGQAYEAMLLRLQTHPLAEARHYGDLIYDELQHVIPAFVERVRIGDRGVAWSRYLRQTRDDLESMAAKLGFAGGIEPATDHRRDPMRDAGVALVEYDPDGERRVAAGCLYPYCAIDAATLDRRVDALDDADLRAILSAAVGDRGNRRHKPGRGFERTEYEFDVVVDYGAWRDVQRHRLNTLQVQDASPALGFEVPADVEAAGVGDAYAAALERSAEAFGALSDAGFEREAQYLLCFGYRVRFSIKMNARQAFHLLELRSSAQGHPSYRSMAWAMHAAIARVHPNIAAAMNHMDADDVDLERLEAERRAARRLAERGG